MFIAWVSYEIPLGLICDTSISGLEMTLAILEKQIASKESSLGNRAGQSWGLA
jgi:hypothetical protein